MVTLNHGRLMPVGLTNRFDFMANARNTLALGLADFMRR